MDLGKIFVRSLIGDLLLFGLTSALLVLVDASFRSIVTANVYLSVICIIGSSFLCAFLYTALVRVFPKELSRD